MARDCRKTSHEVRLESSLEFTQLRHRQILAEHFAPLIAANGDRSSMNVAPDHRSISSITDKLKLRDMSTCKAMASIVVAENDSDSSCDFSLDSKSPSGAAAAIDALLAENSFDEKQRSSIMQWMRDEFEKSTGCEEHQFNASTSGSSFQDGRGNAWHIKIVASPVPQQQEDFSWSMSCCGKEQPWQSPLLLSRSRSQPALANASTASVHPRLRGRSSVDAPRRGTEHTCAVNGTEVYTGTRRQVPSKTDDSSAGKTDESSKKKSSFSTALGEFWQRNSRILGGQIPHQSPTQSSKSLGGSTNYQGPSNNDSSSSSSTDTSRQKVLLSVVAVGGRFDVRTSIADYEEKGILRKTDDKTRPIYDPVFLSPAEVAYLQNFVVAQALHPMRGFLDPEKTSNLFRHNDQSESASLRPGAVMQHLRKSMDGEKAKKCLKNGLLVGIGIFTGSTFF